METGEDVVIAQGDAPVAHLTPVRDRSDARAAREETLASLVGRPPTTTEEIRAWRDEGRRDRADAPNLDAARRHELTARDASYRVSAAEGGLLLVTLDRARGAGIALPPT